MPTLPSVESYGTRTIADRPVPNPVAANAAIRTGQVEASIAAAGEAISQIDEHLTRARRATDLTNALGAATEELNTRSVQASRDQDFKTSPARFKADATAIGQKYAEGITDPVVRQVFANQYLSLVSHRQLGVAVNAGRQEADFNVGKLDVHLDELAKQIAEIGDDPNDLVNQSIRNNLFNQARIAIGENVAAGWITDQDGAKRSIRFGGNVATNVVLQGIADNAELMLQKLTSDAKFLPDLDPNKREYLIKRAEVAVRQNEAQKAKEERAVQSAMHEQFFQKFKDGKLRSTDPLFNENSGASTEVKEQYLKKLKDQASGVEAVDRKGVRNDLWERMFLPYGDERKITDLKPIRDAFLKGDIAERSYQFLSNQFVQAQSDDGQKLMPDVIRAVKTGQKMLASSVIGSVQPEVAIEAGARFEGDLITKVNEYRKANKDPRTLITPGTPDYMLAPANVASYMQSGAQALSGAAKTVSDTARIQEAKAAIAKGASRSAVEKRLKELGLNPALLDAKPTAAQEVTPLDPNMGMPQ